MESDETTSRPRILVRGSAHLFSRKLLQGPHRQAVNGTYSLRPPYGFDVKSSGKPYMILVIHVHLCLYTCLYVCLYFYMRCKDRLGVNMCAVQRAQSIHEWHMLIVLQNNEVMHHPSEQICSNSFAHQVNLTSPLLAALIEI